MTRKCSGVVPQQPPMIRAPESSDRQAYCAINSGVPLKRISPSRNCGMPQFALATRMAVGSAAVARLTMHATSSEGPVPQLLPHAARWCLRCNPASSAGVMPIIVRPLVSKLKVGDTLDVEVQTHAGTAVVVLLSKGKVAGGLASPQVSQLRECIEGGTTYKATVTAANGAVIKVSIEAV